MKQITLDLLDASLREDQESYKKHKFNDRFAIFSRKPVRIDPYLSEQWFAKYDSKKFNWSSPIKFSSLPDFFSLIPENDIGIYIMFVQPNQTIFEMPRFVMNVGISGEKGKARPLKERLSDYQNINQLKRRTNIHQFIQMYYENVYIVYSLFKGNYKELEKTEKVLHEFLYPLYNYRDFEPETKKSKGAWN